jgi:hypothetical protein
MIALFPTPVSPKSNTFKGPVSDSDETVEKERRARGLERMVLRDGTTVREEDCNDGAVEIPACSATKYAL